MITIPPLGFLSLVDHMGSDLSVVNAARVSMGKRKEELDSTDERLIAYLAKHNHTSPFRHASMTFHVKAPIFVARQWAKHQVGCSINEISGRYVELGDEFWKPTAFRKAGENVKQGSSSEVLSDEGEYNASLWFEDAIEHAFASYRNMLDLGVCKEQARAVLPLATYTEFYWTATLQAVAHFLHLREDSHAQAEIREYAHAMKELVIPLFPLSLEALSK